MSVEIRNTQRNFAMDPQREKMKQRESKNQSKRHNMEEPFVKM